MCGIAGIVRLSKGPHDDVELVGAMLDRMSHRGPDQRGVVQRGPACLGAVRLAINGIEDGTQPLLSDDLAFVGNGEVYNQNELRARYGLRAGACDLNVAFRMLQILGDVATQEFEGPFAMASWDSTGQRLVLSRDSVGIKPLFFSAGTDTFAFASEFKALTLIDGVGTALDLRACRDYLLLGFVPGPATPLEGIQAVPPGTTITVDRRGSIATRRFWHPRTSSPDFSADPAVVSMEACQRVTAAVHDCLMVDAGSIGVFLSGGVDSSGVLALAARSTDRELIAFTLVGGGPHSGADSPDVKVAAEFARSLGVRHVEVHFGALEPHHLDEMQWHVEQPITNLTNAIAMRRLAEAAQDAGCKVVLLGEGADEAFGGYHADLLYWTRNEPDSQEIASMILADQLGDWGEAPVAAEHRTSFEVTERILGHPLPSLTHPFPRRLARLSTILPLLAVDPEFFREPPRLPYVDERVCGVMPASVQPAYVDMRTRLEAYILPSRERSTMSAGVEARFPFLNRTLLEWSMQLPPHLRWHDKRLKAMWRDAAATFLPPRVATRPKRGLFMRSFSTPPAPTDEEFGTLNAIGLLHGRALTLVDEAFHQASSEVVRAHHADLLLRIRTLLRLQHIFVEGRGRRPGGAE